MPWRGFDLRRAARHGVLHTTQVYDIRHTTLGAGHSTSECRPTFLKKEAWKTAGNPNQKLKLLYIIDLLKEYTDEAHPMTADEIVNALAVRGIVCERKSIYRDIGVLTDYGYDIVCSRSEPKGFFLAYRDFEVPEIGLLTDAVSAADFISAKKTAQLIEKLQKLISVPAAKINNRRIFIDRRIKSGNEQTYLIIDELQRSLFEGRKIVIEYVRRVFEDDAVKKSVKNFRVSPYALTWADDHYYLICNNEKYDNLMHLRVDRIVKVTVTDEPSRSFTEVSGYKTAFDVADYTARAFNMFGGERQTITLRCRNSALEQIIDRFGSNISPRADGDSHFIISTEALVSEGLISWLLSCSDSAELLLPAVLREKLSSRAKELAVIYGAAQDQRNIHLKDSE